MISSKMQFCTLFSILCLSFIQPITSQTGAIVTDLEENIAKQVVSLPIEQNKLPSLPDSPFQITDNSHFLSYASNPNATGMEGDPYYIENYFINATDSDYGISIANTTSCFVILNCFIYAGWDGILIHNVGESTCVLYNITVVDAWNGIVIEQSPYCLIFQNNLTDCSKGVYLYYTSNQILVNNTLTSCYEGITSHYATCGVYNNTFENCHYGVSCIENWGSYFARNTFLNNQYQAFEVWNSTAFIFNNNMSCTGSTVTRIGEVNSGNFTGNKCFSNKGAEIYVYDSEEIEISNNNLYGCGFRIADNNLTRVESIHTSFVDNHINDKTIEFRIHEKSLSFSGDFGQILLYNCSDIEIRGSTIVQGSMGIFLYECNDTNIDGCYFSDNGIVDIKGEYCYIIEIERCISERSQGFVHLSDSSYGNITDCSVIEFTGAIFLSYTDLFHITRNHFENGVGIAVFLEYCNHNLIFLNNFINNGFPQAWDKFSVESTNFWYSPYFRKGNYWSDYSGSGYYEIFSDGLVDVFDKLPLNSPINFIPENISPSLVLSFLSILTFISIVSLTRRRK